MFVCTYVYTYVFHKSHISLCHQTTHSLYQNTPFLFVILHPLYHITCSLFKPHPLCQLAPSITANHTLNTIKPHPTCYQTTPFTLSNHTPHAIKSHPSCYQTMPLYMQEPHRYLLHAHRNLTDTFCVHIGTSLMPSTYT